MQSAAPLPTNPADRKQRPMARGLLDYFPDALAEVAHVSFVGNQQHNPGEEMHWDRSKSTDHADCAVRHLVERGKVDTDGLRHTAKLAWRALALLQTEIEASRGPATFERLRLIDLSGRRPDEVATVPSLEFAHISPPEPSGHISPRPMTKAEFNAALGRRKVYIAGPMRGIEHFNFPAFDAARDRAKSLGWFPISPADMDRAAGFKETDDTVGPAACREFAMRDTEALLLLRAEHGDAIAMLPGWERSTGALAEFFLARWIGLAILDAETFEPLRDFASQWIINAVSKTLRPE